MTRPQGTSAKRDAGLAFERHDHAHCIAAAMRAAEERCAERKIRLTPVRRRVLEILLQEHKALGAYDILEWLNREGLGSQPPIAYRALDFLVTHGFAHRIERLNAFVACAHPGEIHAPVFMICRKCQGVAEARTTLMKEALGAAARASGFRIEGAVIEAEGLCPSCQGGDIE